MVTEKDNLSKKPTHHSVLQKAASVGYRTRQGKLFSSASTEDSIDPHDASKHPISNKQQPKQRWSLQLFGVKVSN